MNEEWRSTAKWVKDKVRIVAFSNEQLLREFRYLSGGDDYDGCFTADGEKEYELMKEELETRFRAIGFIKEDPFDWHYSPEELLYDQKMMKALKEKGVR